MAGIDKTYVETYEDYKKAYDFLMDTKQKQKDELGYLIPFFKWKKRSFRENEDLPIWNSSTLTDMWLSKNCDIPFVQKRLREQYSSDNWIGRLDIDFNSEKGFVANVSNDDNISIHPFIRVNEEEIDVADKILVYGTTFFEKVWFEVEGIVRGEFYKINDLVSKVDFCLFNLSIEYRNGEYFVDGKEIDYGYFPEIWKKDYFSDKHFTLPKIKHSFKLSDAKKYKDFEIVLSMEDMCFNKDCYKNHENLSPKRLTMELPEYVRDLIK